MISSAHGSSGSDADIYDQDTLDRYVSIYILYPKNIIFSEAQENSEANGHFPNIQYATKTTTARNGRSNTLLSVRLLGKSVVLPEITVSSRSHCCF